MFNDRFNITTAELWSMSPDKFNEWRALNDIPDIFKYFHAILPHFEEWLQHLSVGTEIVYRTINIGQIFQGSEKLLVRRAETHQTDEIWCIDIADFGERPWIDMDFSGMGAAHKLTTKIETQFTPYFHWVKGLTGEKRPVLFDKVNNQRADNFLFGLWRGQAPQSQAFLYRDYPLLKMGNYTLPPGISLAGRNLDFLDLDDLIFGKDVYCQTQSYISYSSIKRLILDGANQHAYTFYNCCFEDTQILNKSSIQGFLFVECEINSFYVTSSTIWDVSFKRCRVLPFITDCDLKSAILFKPADKQMDYGEQTYRLLRIAYQARGMQKEASEYFYQEQVSHRKNLYFPYVKKEVYTVLTSRPGLWKAENTTSATMKHYKNLVKWYLGILASKKKLSLYFSLKSRWGVSWLDSVLWGYGEKPNRIFLCSSLVVLAYSLLFYIFSEGLIYSNNPIDYIDCLYFSAVTFTTLGYGDILPTSPAAKLLCGSEAIVGAFMIGLVVAGFSNRSRY